MKEANPRDMFKTASKSVSTSIILLSPDTFSLSPSTSSTMEISENTKEDPDNPELADAGDLHMEHSSDQLYSQVSGAVPKNYL
jgi:hypothetical protein